MKINRLRLCCLVLPLVLGGCIFSPRRADRVVEPPRPPYPALTSPTNVLLALMSAYQSRDSVEYKLLFDRTRYLGESTDQRQTPVVITDSLSWDDEARHISALARDIKVVKVEINFGVSGSWVDLPSSYVDDPPGSRVIAIQRPSVEVLETEQSYKVDSENSTFEYRFAPNVAAPAETTWTIIHWTEYRQ